MNEERLKALLREAPVPEEREAESRGLRVVRAAFSQGRPAARRPAAVLRRLAVVLSSGALLAGLLLTSAGASVRDWIGDALEVGVRDAEPALTEVPGGGRLLVSSADGAWVVQPDGSRRLLGAYGDATWSPRGLFVAAAHGHALSALEPDGTVRWSLSAPGAVRDPRWSPSGFRIAYRAGPGLRVVNGDGTGGTVLDRRVAEAPAVWSPVGPHVLAYVDEGGTLRVLDADSGEPLASAAAHARTVELDWSRDGDRLLEVAPRVLRVRDVTADKLGTRLVLGAPARVALPVGARVRAASFSPGGRALAVLVARPARQDRPAHSEIYLMDGRGTAQRLLFTAPGRLSGLAWSPDGGRLLISWPAADQWLFVPSKLRGRVRAVAEISREFAPGARGAAGFPRVDGWCCER